LNKTKRITFLKVQSEYRKYTLMFPQSLPTQTFYLKHRIL